MSKCGDIIQLVGHRLQHAVAALFAGWAEMVALDEEHLQQRAALVVDLGRAVLDRRPRLGFDGAG
jgi:hypothetical protein